MAARSTMAMEMTAGSTISDLRIPGAMARRSCVKTIGTSEQAAQASAGMAASGATSPPARGPAKVSYPPF